MESASSMLRLVEPILDREYPHVPADIRRDVLADLPYEAGRSEAWLLFLKHSYTTEVRLEV